MTTTLDLTKVLDGSSSPERERVVMVFGGPYSNLRATVAAKARADELGIAADHVICTGDVVAYCAEPEETTAFVREWGCHVVAGNCEEQLASGAGDCGCGFEEGTACDLLSKGWYPFADARMSAASRQWMRDLPGAIVFRAQGLRFRVIHGGVASINRFVFASDTPALNDETTAADADIVVAGHAGIPFIKTGLGAARRSVWFNAGVIGMPANDGTPDCWIGFIRFARDGVRLSYERLSYDFGATAAAMRRFGYADGYARSLVTGVWPSFDVLPDAERAQTGRRLRARTLAVANR